MPSLSSPSFARLVAALKKHKKTCTVIESSCGGLINASLLAQPGASAVYFGGSVAYNTRRAKPLLLNDDKLHSALSEPLVQDRAQGEREAYIRSKWEWTRRTSLAFCREMDTDFAIAEGGATGPTFRPEGLTTGFATIAIAAKVGGGEYRVVEQELVESGHAHREDNMRFFADRAAELALRAVCRGDPQEKTGTGDQSDAPAHLDRATHLRSDAKTLQEMAQNARYVILHGSSALFRKPNPEPSENEIHNRELSLLNHAQVQEVRGAVGADMELSFLGLLNGREPIFGADLILQKEEGSSIDTLAQLEDAIQNARIHSQPSLFEDTRTVAPLLNPKTCHNEIVIHATALAQWQRRAPFCTVCGSLTILVDGGTSRACTGCGSQSWPRQDPCMIAVVSNRDGSKILLGRSARHPPKMHTGLAGFVEPGETMERAVAREVFEETGIRVDEDSVQYVASQPWPFPQSTMVGFTAKADDSQTLNIDTAELVDARWFDRSQVHMASQVMGPVMQKEVAEAALANNPDLSLLIPPQGVLARRLIDKWLLG